MRTRSIASTSKRIYTEAQRRLTTNSSNAAAPNLPRDLVQNNSTGQDLDLPDGTLSESSAIEQESGERGGLSTAPLPPDKCERSAERAHRTPGAIDGNTRYCKAANRRMYQRFIDALLSEMNASQHILSLLLRLTEWRVLHNKFSNL